jgi:NAD-dependent DNA ligase
LNGTPLSGACPISNLHRCKRQGITLLEKLSESQLNEMIEQANLAYFNENPILSDNEYDIIKEYIAKKFPKSDVLSKIGAPISGKNKVKLPYEMPSMDKIKPDSGALESWKTKFTGPYVLSCKLEV